MAQFVKVATLSDLPPGRSKEVEHEGRIIAIFNVDGTIHAIDGLCPHQGGPLADGELRGSTVACPWHGWNFDVCTGKTPLGTRWKQTVYEVKIENQDVLVSLG